LNEAFEDDIKLTGIVYLHRIADNRMPGSGRKTLRMFQAVCGDNGLESVVLATSHWSRSGPQRREQEGREKELKENPEMWKRMIDKGSRVMRHDRMEESAVEILKYLISLHRPFHTRLQQEMGDGVTTLDKTTAGREIFAELEVQRLMYEKELDKLRVEMDKALREQDEGRQEEIDEKLHKYEERQNQMMENERKLEADADKLRQQKEEQERQLREDLEERLRVSEDSLRIERLRLEQQKAEGRHEMEMRIFHMRLEQMQAERDKYKAALIRERTRCTVM
jgi:hypothetical protein